MFVATGLDSGTSPIFDYAGRRGGFPRRDPGAKNRGSMNLTGVFRFPNWIKGERSRLYLLDVEHEAASRSAAPESSCRRRRSRCLAGFPSQTDRDLQPGDPRIARRWIEP